MILSLNFGEFLPDYFVVKAPNIKIVKSRFLVEFVRISKNSRHSFPNPNDSIRK